MTVNGVVSISISDNKKHDIGRFHKEDIAFTYSGSMVNNGSESATVKLFVEGLGMGQTETSIIIPSGQIVRFRNLKLNGIQVMSASPSIYFLATQYLKPYNEGLKEEAEIFYQ